MLRTGKLGPLLAGAALLALGAACAPAAAPPAPPPAAQGEGGTGGQAVAYHPATKSFLRVGAGGLLRSADAGATWAPAAGLDSGKVSQVALTWARPEQLLAAGEGAGVVRSDDAGKSWRPVDKGLPSRDVAAVAVHVNRPDTLFASVVGKGVFRTENGGTEWQRMDDGPPVSRVNALAHSTLPGSMNTGWLYAAAPEGVYISMDCF